MHRLLPSLAVLVLLSPPAFAETIGGNPGPAHNYVCPHADGQGALDCYFDAVQHLYTMCRNIKAIEIIEYGYEKSGEGLNDAKYASCVDKQKDHMKGPYQAALKEARLSKQAGEAVQGLHEHWLASLLGIRWKAGESDDEYKARTTHVYDEFKERIEGIRTIVAVVRERVSPVGTAAAKSPAKTDAKSTAAKPSPTAKAKAAPVDKAKAAPADKTASAEKPAPADKPASVEKAASVEKPASDKAAPR